MPPSLRYRDFQLFMKRLRRKVGAVRFFMSGEYGDDEEGLHRGKYGTSVGRPHYHAVLFGYDPADKVYESRSHDGSALYSSKSLAELWGLGIVQVGVVSFSSAAYVARYVMKKVTGDMAEAWYDGLVPEFCRMSLGRKDEDGFSGALGMPWLKRFYTDVFPSGKVVVNGKEVFLPKIYSRYMKKREGGSDQYAELELARESGARAGVVDRTPERLAVREQVLKARVARLKRSL
ncbi:MAG: replication initiator protein [Microviridae sp.]|nr:MAG: replication initiator protein [Microviridae sp.]